MSLAKLDLHAARAKQGHKRREREGSIVVVAALTFTTLLGMGAISVDLGRARVAQLEMQYVADAASHAAVQKLDGTAQGVAEATTMVTTIVSQGPVYGITPNVQTVETGYYDATSSTWHSSSDASLIKGLKVTLSVGIGSSGLAKAAFKATSLTARAMGGAAKQSFQHQGTQEAAGEVECYIPIAIPSCVIDKMIANNTAATGGTWQPSTANNVAWADDTGNPSASGLSAQINSLSGGCSGGATMEAGGKVYLNNGMISTVAASIGTFLNNTSTTTWYTAEWGTIPTRSSSSAVNGFRYGHIISGPMVVFNDTSYCTNGGSGALNGTKTIKGFVYAAVYDVVATGDGKNVKLYIPNPNNFTADEVVTFMGGDNGAVKGSSSGTLYNMGFTTSDGGGVSGIPL